MTGNFQRERELRKGSMKGKLRNILPRRRRRTYIQFLREKYPSERKKGIPKRRGKG